MSDKPQPLRINELNGERQRIKANTHAKMPPVEDFTQPALDLLNQDIADSTLEPVSKEVPDVFILRANQIGVELFERKAYHYASMVFGTLLSRAEEYVRQTGKDRHLGALKVNLGVSLIQESNYDAGVSIILEAALQDDVQTYGVSPETSNALTLLHSLVLDEVASHIAIRCSDKFKAVTGFPLGPESVLTMANHTDSLGEATFVSLVPLLQHPEWQKRASSHYGRTRVMDGLRWLSALLESMVRAIGKNSLDPATNKKFAGSARITLWPAYKAFFEGRTSWWPRVKTEQDNHRAEIDHTDSDQDVINKYKYLIGLPETASDDVLVKTTLLSYMTRNLSAHYIEMPAAVIDQIIEAIVEYQLLAQLLFFDWTYRNGHFAKLASPGVWPK